MPHSNNHPDPHAEPANGVSPRFRSPGDASADRAPAVREATALDHRPTGPVTPAGKARSSKNALRHGLYAADPLLPGEDPDLYELFVAGFYESLDPAPGAETSIVHELATLAWRLRRAAGAEIDIYRPDTHPLPPRGTPLIWLGGPRGQEEKQSSELFFAPQGLDQAPDPLSGRAKQQPSARSNGRTHAVPSPALPPNATPGQVYLYRLRTDGDPFRGLSRHAEYMHRQFCRDLAAFHTLRRIRLDREADPPPGRPRNPYRDRRDKYGEVIGRYSTRPDHARLWDLEVELGLHDRDGNLPDPEDPR